MNDVIIEVVDQNSEFEGKFGKIIEDIDKCGIMVVHIFEDNKITFLNEKQYRIVCTDEILWNFREV